MTAAQRVAERREVRLVQAARVDPAHAARDDDDARRVRRTIGNSSSRASARVLLGVVQRAQRAQLARRQRVVVEQHACRDERPREAAASGLVGAGDQRHAEAAVEGEQATPASRARLRRARRREREDRAGDAAQRQRAGSEDADAVGRPVGGEGSADDP